MTSRREQVERLPGVRVLGAVAELLADASVPVVIVSSPSFGRIIAVGDGSFILSGTGGGSNGAYYVLTTTNLTLPLTNWTYIATNQFDNLGGFIFTNVAQTNAPQQFYILQQP